MYKRTTAKRCEPTKEEEELLNCEVSTDFGDMGIHKGYIADVGYDSEDDETQIDIIYEDQDIRTVRAIEALLGSPAPLGSRTRPRIYTRGLRNPLVLFF